jgi:hypothetical protein
MVFNVKQHHQERLRRQEQKRKEEEERLRLRQEQLNAPNHGCDKGQYEERKRLHEELEAVISHETKLFHDRVQKAIKVYSGRIEKIGHNCKSNDSSPSSDINQGISLSNSIDSDTTIEWQLPNDISKIDIKNENNKRPINADNEDNIVKKRAELREYDKLPICLEKTQLIQEEGRIHEIAANVVDKTSNDNDDDDDDDNYESLETSTFINFDRKSSVEITTSILRWIQHQVRNYSFCDICDYTVENGVAATCGHIYCEECIRDHLSTDNSLVCPARVRMDNPRLINSFFRDVTKALDRAQQFLLFR